MKSVDILAVLLVVTRLTAGEDVSGAYHHHQLNLHDDDNDSKISCRVAVCLSGHARSFVSPAVHLSVRRNVIEAIEADGCRVDVFAYAALEDATSTLEEQVSNYCFAQKLLVIHPPAHSVYRLSVRSFSTLNGNLMTVCLLTLVPKWSLYFRTDWYARSAGVRLYHTWYEVLLFCCSWCCSIYSSVGSRHAAGASIRGVDTKHGFLRQPPAQYIAGMGKVCHPKH